MRIEVIKLKQQGHKGVQKEIGFVLLGWKRK